MKFLMKIFRCEDGTTAIEYSIIAAGIAVVIITAVQLVGSSVSGTFSSAATAISGL